MKIGNVSDSDPYIMYGKYPSRNIYYNFEVTDSLSELWQKETNGSFSSTSVSIYGDFIFTGDLSGRMTAFNIDGSKKGEVKTKGAVYSAPYINKSTLIYLTVQKEKLLTYMNFWDIYENKPLKEVEVNGRILSEMLIERPYMYLCSETGKVFKYDLQGEKIWEVKTSAMIYSSPVMQNGILYFGNAKGEVIAMNSEKGDIVYQKKVGSSFNGGSIISGDDLFIADDIGVLYSVDLKSGGINWKYISGTKIMMAPASDNNNVYCGNLAGDFFSLNKKSGMVNWNKTIGKLFNTAPVVTANYLLIPDLYKKLLFVDKKTGEVKKTKEYQGRVRMTPVIYKEKILITGSDNGVLNAYEFK